MAKPRHLSRAPITEAIFDLRVKHSRTIDPDTFLPVHDHIRDQFPTREARQTSRVTFTIGQRTSDFSSQQLGTQGYFFKSSDEKTIAQYRPDGFTLNRLNPYTSWDELFPQVMSLWRLYIQYGSPESVTRIAARYINHIPMLEQAFDLAKVMTASPPLPPELPQFFTSLLTRFSILDQSKSLAANVVQALENDPARNLPTLILDVDAYHQRNVPPGDIAVETIFAELHEFKNVLFFSLLTDETVKRFE